MKKLLLIAAAFLVAAPIFAQTEKKITEKKPVASETKTVVKKEPGKKDAKVAISKDLKEADPAEKKSNEKIINECCNCNGNWICCFCSNCSCKRN